VGALISFASFNIVFSPPSIAIAPRSFLSLATVFDELMFQIFLPVSIWNPGDPCRCYVGVESRLVRRQMAGPVVVVQLSARTKRVTLIHGRGFAAGSAVTPYFGPHCDQTCVILTFTLSLPLLSVYWYAQCRRFFRSRQSTRRISPTQPGTLPTQPQPTPKAPNPAGLSGTITEPGSMP